MEQNSCVLTHLVAFVKHQFQESKFPSGVGNEFAVVYSRLYDVFGWKRVETTRDAHTVKYKFSLGRNDYRLRRPMSCGIVHVKHNCDKFNFGISVPILRSRNQMDKMAEREVVSYLKWVGKSVMTPSWRGDCPVGQADVEGADGSGDQEVDPSENTVITTDVAVTSEQVVSGSKGLSKGARDLVMEACSTEKYHQFQTILNRWVPLMQIKMTTTTGSDGKPFQVFDLPEDLKKIACVPNTLPFEQFMYGQFDIHMLFKVNSNKFQAGRIMASVLLDPIGFAGEYSLHWSSGFQRPHVMIDLANATTGEIHVPWRYHRGLLRNLEKGQNSSGVRGGIYARVELYAVQPISIASGQDDTVNILPFVKLTKADFAGMAYQVPVAQIENDTFQNIMKMAEASMTMATVVSNLDKPRCINRFENVVPTPRLFFPHGKGLSDATVLHLNPTTTTAHHANDAFIEMYTDIKDIAKQWGFLESFNWQKNQVQGSELGSWVIDPTCFAKLSSGALPTEFYTVPPVCFVSRMYQYWRGSLEFRFEFVSTSFHSGSVTLAVEFGRTSSASDFCQSYASYNKTFDLGEKKVCEMVVPYIYDTPIRRNNVLPYHCVAGKTASATAIKAQRNGLMLEINTRLVMRVANSLKAATTVVDPIKVLVYVKAGKSFELYGLVQSNSVFKEPEAIKDFPSDSFPATNAALKKKAHTSEIASAAIQNCNDVALKLQAAVEDAKVAKDAVQLEANARALSDAEITVLKDRISRLTDEKDRLTTELTAIRDSGNCADLKDKVEMFDKQIKIMEKDMNFFVSRASGVVYDQQDLPVVRVGSYALKSSYATGYTIQSVWAESPRYRQAASSGSLTGKFIWVRLPAGQSPVDGDDENHDEGYFNHGARIQALITSTGETSIYDIMRRPVCMAKDMIVKAAKSEGAFYIPVLPPQWIYCSDGSVFNDFVSTSPHVVITSMFRFWRGSIRYTFVVTRGSKPIYIAYLPHSGARIFGNSKSITKSEDLAYDTSSIVCTGLSADMMVPYINPTHVVETPYTTENVWTLLNNGALNKNRNWRDFVDDNAGHIVIETSEEVTMDVFIHAGDDFRLAGFIGTPPVRFYRNYDTLSDDAPVGQVDFRLIEDLLHGQQFSRVCMKLSPFVLAGATAACMYTQSWAAPIFSAITVARMMHGVTKAEDLVDEGVRMLSKARDILDGPPRIDNAIEAISATALDLGKMVNSITDSSELVQALINKTGEGIEKMFPGLNAGHLVTKGLIDVITLWFQHDKIIVCNMIARWLVDFGLLTLQHLPAAMNIVSSIFKYITTPVAHIKFNLEGLSKMCMEIALVVGKSIGASISKITNITVFKCMQGLFQQMSITQGFAGVKCITTFITDFFSFIQRLYYYYFCDRDSELELAYMLTDRNSALVGFVTKMQYFSAEWNKGELLMSSQDRIDFYATIQMAYLVQSRLVGSTMNNTYTALLNTISTFLKRANELQNEIGSCPVRYEPFVLSLCGGSGIGKSFMCSQIAADLNKDVYHARSAGELVYTRTPGTDFWDGYKNQPIILFDDFMNLSTPEQIVQQCADLYMLKSSAAFLPNMARLEDKGVKGNPVLVILLTNNPFPDLHEVPCKDAMDRRRDWLVHVDKVSDYKEDFSHLSFTPYVTPIRGKDGKGVKLPKSMNYADFYRNLVARTKAYHEKESINTRNRFATMMESLGRVDYNLADVDPYRITFAHLFDQSIPQGNTLPEAMQAKFKLYLDAKGYDDVVAYISAGYGQSVVGQVGDAETTGQYMQELLSPDSFEGHVKMWQRVIEYIFPPSMNVLEQSECVVCRSANECVAVCTRSTQESRHSVCATCYMRMAEAGPPPCPVCRGNTLKLEINSILVRYEKAMAAVTHILGYGTCNLVNFIKALARIVVSVAELVHKVNLVMIVMLLLQQHYFPAVVTAYSCAWHSFIWDSDQFKGVIQWVATHVRNGAQLAFMWAQSLAITGMGAFAAYDPDGFMGYAPVMDPRIGIVAGQSPPIVPRLIMYSETVETGGVCRHRGLNDAATVYYTYETLEWRWHHNDEWKTAPNIRCRVTCEDQPCVLSREEHLLVIWDNMIRTVPCVVNWYNLAMLGDDAQKRKIPCQYVGDMPSTSSLVRELQAYGGKSWWDVCKTKTAEVIRRLAPWIAGIGAFGAVCYGIIKLIKSLTSTFSGETISADETTDLFTEVVQAQMSLPKDVYDREKAIRSAARRRAHKKFRTPMGHGGYGGNEKYLNIIGKLLKNCVQIRIYDEERNVGMLSGLAVRGRTVLMPYHYMDFMRLHQDKTFKVWMMRDPHREFPYEFDESDFEHITDDVMVWTPGPAITNFADITKFMVREEDLLEINVSDKVFVIVPPTKTSSVGMVHTTRISAWKETQEVKNPTTGDYYMIKNVMQYTFSLPGACGSLVFQCRGDRPLMGIHVAGYGRSLDAPGFGIAVTQEMAESFNPAGQMDCSIEELNPAYESKVYLPPEVCIVEEGTLKDGKEVFQPTNTKVVPSLLQSISTYKPEKEPAPLSASHPTYKNTGKTPLVEGCRHHGELTTGIPRKQLDGVEGYLEDYIGAIPPIAPFNKPLTIEQALIGHKVHAYMEPLDLDTSSGYPWSLVAPSTLKSEWVQYERDEHLRPVKAIVHPHVEEAVGNGIRLRENRVLVRDLFVDSLKDEKRKKSAVQTVGKTRVICMSPLHLTIITRMYLLPLLASFYNSYLDMYHACGISPDGIDWTVLYNKLTSKNENKVMSIDYKNFGPGFNSYLAHTTIPGILKWCRLKMKYTDKDLNVVEMLLLQFFNSTHLMKDYVYTQICGAPSGSAITTMLNTFVNWAHLLWAFQELVCKKQLTTRAARGVVDIVSLSDFDKYVYMCAYGDDNIFSVREEILQYFNMQTIATLFKERCGITITSCKKGEEMPPYLSYHDVDFLQRRFMPFAGSKGLRFLAPIDISMVKEACLWTHSTLDEVEGTLESVAASMLLAYGHGPQVFQEHKNEVNRCLDELNLKPVMVTWYEIDDIFFPPQAQVEVFEISRGQPNPVMLKVGFSSEEETRIAIQVFMDELDETEKEAHSKRVSAIVFGEED